MKNLVTCLASMLMLMVSAMPRSAGAHERVGCNTLDDNSCWHARNDSGSSMDVRCKGYGRDRLFSAQSLEDSQTYAYQYSQGWADGLGYFEPGVAIRCRAAAEDGRNAVVDFMLTDYGDRVSIQMTEEELVVVVRAFWSKQVRIARTPWG